MGMSMMKGKATFFLLLLLPVFFSVGYAREEERGERGRGEIFLLQHSKQVFQTDAGQMRVVRGLRTKGVESPMHIGFITMEPNTFFIPQYIDSNLIIFVHEGTYWVTTSLCVAVCLLCWVARVSDSSYAVSCPASA
uniref:Uncharacterized protein n=1 Tax=Nelumbo nucifera TaxID=4432 RepID=A0A822Y8N7_NELNU|nr:TPA_asm: hypothetical protein HUJ06_029399 [Nelumbo nucifera]